MTSTTIDELSDEQIDQQDLVDNCIEELLISVGFNGGDIENRGKLRDAVSKAIQELFDIDPDDFYPSLPED